MWECSCAVCVCMCVCAVCVWCVCGVRCVCVCVCVCTCMHVGNHRLVLICSLKTIWSCSFAYKYVLLPHTILLLSVLYNVYIYIYIALLRTLTLHSKIEVDQNWIKSGSFECELIPFVSFQCHTFKDIVTSIPQRMC